MRSFKRLISPLTLTAALLSSTLFNAQAALPINAKAPDFQLHAFLGGKPMEFSLQHARHQGLVVLYFFPAAFTAGCTLEAHDFAEATDQFNKLGATVVGVTAGNTDQIQAFSKVECRDKFAVAADPAAKVAAQYDTAVKSQGKTLSERTSYVISSDGYVLFSYTDQNPEAHIEKAMAAVKQYRASHLQAK